MTFIYIVVYIQTELTDAVVVLLLIYFIGYMYTVDTLHRRREKEETKFKREKRWIIDMTFRGSATFKSVNLSLDNGVERRKSSLIIFIGLSVSSTRLVLSLSYGGDATETHSAERKNIVPIMMKR